MAIRRRSKLDEPYPVICSDPECSSPATILHKLKPYCGKHALELAESGEGFERRFDYIPSVPEPKAVFN